MSLLQTPSKVMYTFRPGVVKVVDLVTTNQPIDIMSSMWSVSALTVDCGNLAMIIPSGVCPTLEIGPVLLTQIEQNPSLTDQGGCCASTTRE